MKTHIHKVTDLRTGKVREIKADTSRFSNKQWARAVLSAVKR